MGFDRYRCVPTVYFRFRNYQNTDVVFVPENTIPLSFFMKKIWKWKWWSLSLIVSDRFHPYSQCPLFSLVNHIDYRDRYIGEDRTTRVRYVGSISLLVCTVSPDGDCSRYGQAVRTIEKEHEPIYSHHDAINSYQSHTVHQSIYLIWTDCKTLNKSISLYAHLDQKLNMIALVPLLGKGTLR